MNLLITSIGKRVQLIKHLKESFNVIGVDANEENATKEFVDNFYKVPKVKEKDYVDKLVEICKKNDVKALVPLYEEEFIDLINRKKEFESIGVKLILSNKDIINICKSKSLTFEFFKDSNIKVPHVYSNDEVEDIIVDNKSEKFPLIIKPDSGMGSLGVFKVINIKELEFFKEYVHNSIVQECITGDEYTVDVLVDFNGQPVYIIPRLRVEVRSGEVTKSKTVKDTEIINETIKVIEKLNTVRDCDGKSIFGPLTIQFFKDNKGIIQLLEINPRFGGGVPLSFEAGANYGKVMFNMLKGNKLEYKNDYKEMTMLRYDQAVFR